MIPPLPFGPARGANVPGAEAERPEPPDESRSDPAADAALKRRIEHQIRETAGDKLRSFDVRVSGRKVAIEGRVARFWFRRPVRRALETLPALAGLQPSIEILD